MSDFLDVAKDFVLRGVAAQHAVNDEIHHRKILAEPFAAILHAHDYVFQQRAEWLTGIRLAASQMLLQKAYEVSMDHATKKEKP